MRPPVLLVLLLASCAPGPVALAEEPSRAPPDFWAHWGDGLAELSGYDLVQPRYGQLRMGTAILVYVTETFTSAQRVKSEGGHSDEYPVLKLNEVRTFQTGIYDYRVLTSTFVPLDGRLARGLPTKVSFSSQEWCGHVYDQVVIDPDQLTRVWHSYFDGEGDGSSTTGVPPGGVFADAMPVLVRGLAGDLLAPGESRSTPWWPRLIDSRFAHESPAWSTAVLSRSVGTETVVVPAGVLTAWTVTATLPDATTFTWWVEAAEPHRLVAWEGSTGERGALRATTRQAYWKLNAEGGEAALEALGLPVPVSGAGVDAGAGR